MTPSRWHTQTAQLEARDTSAPDTYDGATYAAPVTIACRLEHDRKRIRDAAGAEVVSEARLFTLAAVKPGDRITDPAGVARIVMRADELRDVRGRFVQWEVRL